MDNSFNRIDYLTSHGNYAIMASGKSLVNPKGKGTKYNIRAGELAFINPKTNVTLSLAEIATEKHIALVVGVGKKGSMASEVRYVGGDGYDMCDFKVRAEVTAPVCPVPQVLDIYFDEIDCGKNYSLLFELDDYRARSQFQMNEYIDYVFPLLPDCKGCDDCEAETASVDDAICKAVEEINKGKNLDVYALDQSKKSRFFRDAKYPGYQPFGAARLFGGAGKSKTFCFTPTGDTECSTCMEVTGVYGINIDGERTVFVNTLKPGTTDVTLLEQLDAVVAQINEALAATGGSAYLTQGGPNGCCQWSIEVNSCHDVVKLTVDDTPDNDVDPCNSSNPFADITIPNQCKDCTNNADGTYTPTKGIRIFLDQVPVTCEDLPSKSPIPNYFGRSMKIGQVGDGWDCSNFYVVEKQKQVLPQGFGLYYQNKERYAHKGGPGKDYRNSNEYKGTLRYGIDEWSRDASTTVDCEEAYCVYNIDNITQVRANFNNATNHFNQNVGHVLIPEGDTVTQNSFESYLSALRDRGLCVSDGNIACIAND